MVFDVRVSCRVRLCASLATGCECRGTTLRSKGKASHMKHSVTSVLSRNYTSSCRTTPNQIMVLGLPRRGCRNINPWRRSGFLVAVCNCKMF